MRIALITPGFSAHAGDWAIPALLNLARTLAQKHDVYIFSQRYPAQGTYQFDNLTHHALGGGQNFGLSSLRIWLKTSQAVIRQHQKTPFDLLHAFWADEAGFAAVIAGHKIKRPVIVSLAGGELSRLPNINYGAQRFLARRLITRYALKKASLVTAGSQYQLDLCRDHQVSKRKLRLAPLGVDTHHFQPSPPLPCSPAPLLPHSPHPTIIQVASLIPVKNQILLLEILSLVKKKIPNIKLNLVGSGLGQDELVKLAYQLNLSQNITWHGQILYSDLRRLYQESHLSLQTSYHEAQGMAMLEAMACGLPVLGTPVGVVREVACRPAHTGADVLSNQAIDILSDEASYLQLRHQARLVVEEEFSLTKTTNNFLRIYEDLKHLLV
jgi:glycosyltransferase involved in cell wall biosynthesis